MSDNEYVALQPINHLGVRAYNVGDRVPADNVKAHEYEIGVQVAEVGSTEAGTATSPPADEGDKEQAQDPPADPTTPAPEPATDTTRRTARGKSS